MNSIYVIVTHHKRPNEAAEAWKDNELCAIGFTQYGNLKKAKKGGLTTDPRLFSEIEKGDLILAYAKNNKIALVGEVVGEYQHTTDNIIGKNEEKGGFGYPNQYKVRWFSDPHDFDRKNLPEDLWKQMGRTGVTVKKLELGKRSFDQVKNIIFTCAISGSLSEIGNEDLIKAGLGKYIKKKINTLEEGLVILESEKQINENDRLDFLARDNNGNDVIIECKGTAYALACDQVEQYAKYFPEHSRLFLVAFNITHECKKRADKNKRIELYECELTFKKI